MVIPISLQEQTVALTGILIARPEDSLTRDAILPHLDYWNRRSGDAIDFFCVGYLPEWHTGSTSRAESFIRVGNGEWAFASSAFDELLSDIEREAAVAYDGSPWLLLLNAHFDGRAAHLDYSRLMWVNFREALSDDAISTPTQLAEHVFRFVRLENERPHSSNDPVWELSESLGRRVLRRGALDALFAVLPEWLKPSAKRAIHFSIR